VTLPAVNHLSPVVGIDVHMVRLPPSPAPVPLPHPHVGFMLDLREYVSEAVAAIGCIVFDFIEQQAAEFVDTHAQQVDAVMQSGVVEHGAAALDDLTNSEGVRALQGGVHALHELGDRVGSSVGKGGGGPVLINGLLRATAGTHAYHAPGLHFPFGAGFAGMDASGPSSDAESFMGSRTVLANGDPLSFMALPALSCWCAGLEPMDHNGAHTRRAYPSLPTATMLPLPATRPVLVGGVPVVNLTAASLGLLRAFRGSALSKKLFAKFPSGFIKCQMFDAEPVNSVTGEVVVQQRDFEIAGRLPLVWERHYASHEMVAGAVGYGWQSPADIRLELARDGERFGAAARFPDHSTTFDALPDDGGWKNRVYDWQHGHALYMTRGALVLRTRAGIEYVFTPADHWRQHVPQLEDGRLVLPVVRIADLNGNAWRFDRADEGEGRGAGDALRLVETARGKPTGREVRCGVGNVAHCIGSMSLHDGRQGVVYPLVRYEQDETADLIAVFDALGEPYRFEYAGSHLMVRHTDRNGLSFHYEHGCDSDNVWRVEHAWGDGGLYDYRFIYDRAHLETRFTDSLGHTTILQYNGEQSPVARIDGTGAVRSYRYDRQGRTSAEVDPAGQVTTWTWDAYGNLLEHALPDRSVVRIDYDDAHRPTRIVDAEGGCWQQQWDVHGNLLRQITPMGIATSFGYNQYGHVIAVIDAERQMTRLRYDSFGYLTDITDALGGVTRYEHDARGNLLQMVDANGDATRYAYDAKGRLTDCLLPGELTVQYEYDAADNLICYRDEAGQVTRFGYFGQGCLARRVEADGSVVQYHYDTEERLVGVSNALGQTWRLQRDAAGRLVGETDYYGQTQRYSYDAAGHLTRTIDPLGGVLNVRCDVLGRATGRESKQGDLERFAYNRRGQLTEASNRACTVRREYDADGRIVRETQQQAHLHGTLEYEYDAAGRLRSQRRRLQGASGSTFDFTQTFSWRYDALGQPHLLQVDAHEPIRFSHDEVGRLVDIRFGGGLQQRHEYDQAGRLSRRTVFGAGQRADYSAFAYDPVGNLIARFDSRLGEDTYRYDLLGRICEHVDPGGRLEKFVVDVHGDRFATSGDISGGRASRHADDTVWRLDAAGQLVERQEGGARHRLEWDCFGRLKHFDNGRGKRCLYEYDALGRRVSKVEIRGGDNLAQPLGTGFLWDGDALAGEVRFSPARSELDQASPRAGGARFYLYQPDSFEPLVMQVHGFSVNGGEENSAAASPTGRDRVYYYQNDLNGAPVRLRDGDGEVVWEAHYSATGMTDSVATESIDQPLRLQGQYLDAESNQHYNRHRYFDPRAGYFISQDPIGLEGGENQYEFAPNIFGWTDPLGLRLTATGKRQNISTTHSSRKSALEAAAHAHRGKLRPPPPKRPPSGAQVGDHAYDRWKRRVERYRDQQKYRNAESHPESAYPEAHFHEGRKGNCLINNHHTFPRGK
jgi:RHS repeat-associated protein